jgi:hypothetical protein
MMHLYFAGFAIRQNEESENQRIESQGREKHQPVS